MVFLLVFDIIDDTIFLSLTVGESTITALPSIKKGEFVLVGTHIITCGDFQIVNKGGHGNGWMQPYTQMNMIGHTANTIEHTLMVFAEAQNISV